MVTVKILRDQCSSSFPSSLLTGSREIPESKFSIIPVAQARQLQQLFREVANLGFEGALHLVEVLFGQGTHVDLVERQIFKRIHTHAILPDLKVKVRAGGAGAGSNAAGHSPRVANDLVADHVITHGHRAC